MQCSILHCRDKKLFVSELHDEQCTGLPATAHSIHFDFLAGRLSTWLALIACG